MTPADRRIAELIDKWLASIDLHMKYAALDDAAYFQVQPWPRHDRPTRWVLEVARQKILDLKEQCATRQSMGDSKFAEALESMAFLANLVGLQHIQRFIPLADPARENAATGSTATVEAPTVAHTLAKMPAGRARGGEDATREMPRLKAAAAKPAAAQAHVEGPKANRTAPAAKAAAAPAAKAATAPAQKPVAVTPEVKTKVIADAVRLLKWGKPWHELAELVGRIADRPAVGEIRKILRANKQEIESKAAKEADGKAG